jgi:hypothetical protein
MRFGRDGRKNWQRVVGKVRFKSLADRAHVTIAFAYLAAFGINVAPPPPANTSSHPRNTQCKDHCPRW